MKSAACVAKGGNKKKYFTWQREATNKTVFHYWQKTREMRVAGHGGEERVNKEYHRLNIIVLNCIMGEFAYAVKKTLKNRDKRTITSQTKEQ